MCCSSWGNRVRLHWAVEQKQELTARPLLNSSFLETPLQLPHCFFFFLSSQHFWGFFLNTWQFITQNLVIFVTFLLLNSTERPEYKECLSLSPPKFHWYHVVTESKLGPSYPASQEIGWWVVEAKNSDFMQKSELDASFFHKRERGWGCKVKLPLSLAKYLLLWSASALGNGCVNFFFLVVSIHWWAGLEGLPES